MTLAQAQVIRGETGFTSHNKVYCGYWFWGRPSVGQLWVDLPDLFCRTKADFDPTTAEARSAWRAVQPQSAKLPVPRARKRQPARVS